MALIDKSASPSSKLDAILYHLGSYVNPTNGQRSNIGGTEIDASMQYMNYDHNHFGLSSYQEMVFYLETLISIGFIKRLSNENNERKDYLQNVVQFPSKIKITFEGLQRIYEIENHGALSNKCFVAMVFDQNKNDRLNAIKSACAEYGFEAFDVENYNIKGNQTIDSKIISAIKSSRFCIADFTGLNQGAYFEGGYAMGRNMKVIFTCEKKDFSENKKHFDVSHYPFICYDDFNDLTTKLKNE